MTAWNILTYGQKAIFVLLPKLYWSLTSEVQEGGQFGSAALNCARFYGVDLEGSTKVTVGLYGNAKDGYEFKIDSKKYAPAHISQKETPGCGSATMKGVLDSRQAFAGGI